jgi:hypothetical protein
MAPPTFKVKPATTYVHVDPHVIMDNARHKTRKPPIVVYFPGQQSMHVHGVKFKGASRVVYEPDNPHISGAQCWVETEGDVEVIRLDQEGA